MGLFLLNRDYNGPYVATSLLVEGVVRAVAAREVLALPTAAEGRDFGDGVLLLHLEGLVAVEGRDRLELGRGRAARGDRPAGDGAREREGGDEGHIGMR